MDGYIHLSGFLCEGVIHIQPRCAPRFKKTTLSEEVCLFIALYLNLLLKRAPAVCSLTIRTVGLCFVNLVAQSSLSVFYSTEGLSRY